MDIATLIGLIVAFGMVIGAMASDGSFGSFINLPSILIVVGGTISVTMISFTIRENLRGWAIVLKTFSSKVAAPGDAADMGIRMAVQARKEGVLVLQKSVPNLDDRPFLQKSLVLAIDGTSGEDIERVMGQELDGIAGRHTKGVAILRRAAEVAPAMGLIGTLIGLVQMLGKLDDPSAIGPAMAVALLTTFYGAVLANMVFTPMAAKLERNSHAEIMVNRIYLTAAAAIGRSDNPRRLEMLLNTILPPEQRLHYFD